MVSKVITCFYFTRLINIPWYSVVSEPWRTRVDGIIDVPGTTSKFVWLSVPVTVHSTFDPLERWKIIQIEGIKALLDNWPFWSALLCFFYTLSCVFTFIITPSYWVGLVGCMVDICLSLITLQNLCGMDQSLTIILLILAPNRNRQPV